jgi:hypothetical protein
MIANLNVCIEAMHGVALSRRKALLVELSVGLVVFCGAGNAEKAAMRTLTEIYASAGDDCLKREGLDYQSVHYRVNACADLFNHLTMPLIIKWAADKKNMAAINEIATQLNILNISSVEDVLRLCGKKPEKPVSIAPAPKPHAEKGHDHVYHVKSAHLMLDIPDNIEVSEIMDLAQKLLALVARIEKKKAA